MTDRTKLLRVAGVAKSYSTPEGRVAVLRGADLSLGAGESLALTGESGSGKSTLLHLIAGLDRVDEGEIWLGDASMTRLGDTAQAELRRAKIGIVFQQFNLIPSLTVRDNLAFQARLAGRYDGALTDGLLARLGLTKLGHRYPEQLSGGQQQRVAIGRALAVRPALLLADEPTGNLDEETGDEVMGLMLDLVAEAGAALLMVTHSPRLAGRLQRQLRLEHGLLVGARSP